MPDIQLPHTHHTLHSAQAHSLLASCKRAKVDDRPASPSVWGAQDDDASALPDLESTCAWALEEDLLHSIFQLQHLPASTCQSADACQRLALAFADFTAVLEQVSFNLWLLGKSHVT